MLRSKRDLPRQRLPKDHFERQAKSQGYSFIAGVDEAGRGPIAGPLVVAACILREGFCCADIDDSKKLTPSKRERIYERIVSDPLVLFSAVVIEPVDIDRLNILQATLHGMQRAVLELLQTPDFVLIDGNQCPTLPMPSLGIIEGDALSYSIGAASIVAKVTRDRIMLDYHKQWPEYNFAQHKGYPTAEHKRCLSQIGPCPIHRRSYAPVQKVLPFGRVDA